MVPLGPRELRLASPPAIGLRISGLEGSSPPPLFFLDSDFLEENQLPDMDLVVLPASGGDDLRDLEQHLQQGECPLNEVRTAQCAVAGGGALA